MKPTRTFDGCTRRAVLRTGVGLVGSVCVRSVAAAPDDPGATAPDLAAAVAAFAGGAQVHAGRVTLDVAPLVENGNTVPIAVNVASPMSEADHVQAIAVFNERNPQRDVAIFRLGPRAGRATVATRIRLATSQKLVAVAQMSDGSFWSHTVDVIVTLAACVET
jgi:sulfur-oxidizing protein SoxY